MRLFNSFQLVAVFAVLPFVVSWLSESTMKYANAAFWAVLIVYVLAALGMWRSVYDSSRKDGPFDL